MDNNRFQSKSPKGGPSKGGKFKNAGFIAFLALIGLIIFTATNQSPELDKVPLSEVVDRANEGEFSRIEITGNELEITEEGEDEPTLTSIKEEGTIYEQGLERGVDGLVVDIQSESTTGRTFANIGISLLPVLIIAAILIFIFA